MSQRIVLLATLLTLAISAQTWAQAPTTKPAADFAITPMRLQTLNATEAYLYAETETTLATIQQAVSQLLDPLVAAADAGKIQTTGPVIFVYSQMDADMSKPFKLQVGSAVKPGSAAFEPYQLRSLAPLRAATVVYSGSLANLSQAYGQIYNDLFASGLTPSGENREIYPYWEGADSVNNVIIIQIGVQ